MQMMMLMGGRRKQPAVVGGTNRWLLLMQLPTTVCLPLLMHQQDVYLTAAWR
jgi:hypothetical protein